MDENGNKLMLIELIYALPDEQEILTIEVSNDCDIQNAIIQSNILELYPEIDLKVNRVGVFSKVSKLTDTLRDGDRIEIYRPLIIDPKEARKARALKQKK